MAPSAADIDIGTLIEATTLEIETLKQMKDGSATLFDNLICEADKRKATLSHSEKATKAMEAANRSTYRHTTGIATRHCQQILSVVRRDIEAYKGDLQASANRYKVATDDAEATYKLNTAKTKLVEGAATALEDTGTLVYELRNALTAVKSDGSDELLARVDVTIAEIGSRVSQLGSDFQALHKDRDEYKAMTEAKSRAGKVFYAEKASLEKRLRSMRAIEASLMSISKA